MGQSPKIPQPISNLEQHLIDELKEEPIGIAELEAP